MIDAIGILISIVAIPAGALITFITARKYYLSAAKDLKQEAEELRRLNTLVLRALREGGVVDLNVSDSGDIAGLKLSAEASLVGTSSIRATVT